MRKKIISAFLTLLIITTTAIPALANESQEILPDSSSIELETQEMDTNGMEIGDMSISDSTMLNSAEFSNMNDLMQAANTINIQSLMGQSASLSESVNEIFGLSAESMQTTMNTSDLMLHNSFDVGVLDMQYSMAAENLLNGFQDQVTNAGKAQTGMQLFANTYGDVLSGLKLDSATLPKNFNVNDMMKSATKSMNSAYGSAISSGEFAAVKNSIGLSNSFSLFNQASSDLKKGSDVSESMLTANLGSMLSNTSSGIKSQIASETSGNTWRMLQRGQGETANMASTVTKSLFAIAGIDSSMKGTGFNKNLGISATGVNVNNDEARYAVEHSVAHQERQETWAAAVKAYNERTAEVTNERNQVGGGLEAPVRTNSASDIAGTQGSVWFDDGWNIHYGN